MALGMVTACHQSIVNYTANVLLVLPLCSPWPCRPKAHSTPSLSAEPVSRRLHCRVLHTSIASPSPRRTYITSSALPSPVKTICPAHHATAATSLPSRAACFCLQRPTSREIHQAAAQLSLNPGCWPSNPSLRSFHQNSQPRPRPSAPGGGILSFDERLCRAPHRRKKL